MLKISAVTLLLAAASGCIFYDADDPDTVIVDDDTVVVRNAEPYVFDATSGCYYDPFNADDIWFFDAWVDDADGVFDVVQVWADVYDDYSGQLVQSFELYPTQNANEWYSDWLVSTTWLDCWYNGYSVDIIAYDSFDAPGGITIWPSTYVY